jgi:hypothetical protein
MTKRNRLLPGVAPIWRNKMATLWALLTLGLVRTQAYSRVSRDDMLNGLGQHLPNVDGRLPIEEGIWQRSAVHLPPPCAYFAWGCF